MADLSQIPIEELMRLREQMAPAPAQAHAEATPQQVMPDLGSMPIEQLMALRDQARQQPSPPAAPQGGDQPWYSKLGGAADDMARIVANGLTLGAADKFAGYMGGKGYDAEKQATGEARDRAGYAAYAGDVIGAAAPFSAAAKGGATLVGAVAPKVAANAGVLGRTAGMGAVGAGLGAGEAAIKDDDIAKGALIGGLAGAGGNLAGEALSSGVSKVAGAFNKKPVIPQTDDLVKAKDAAYARADAAGVAYTPSALGRLNQRVTQALSDIGYDPSLQSGAAPALKRIQELQGQNITMSGLDTIRKVASNGYMPATQTAAKSNNKAIADIIDAIDDVTANPRVGEVLMGNSQAGGEALKEARGLASRVFKAEKLENAVDLAGLRTKVTGTGGNVDNATRQDIFRELKKGRGYTADEKEAMRAVIEGTPTQNALRLAGRLSPTTGGLSALLNVGATAVNPLMAIPALGGAGAKVLADRGTQANVQKLAEIIRAGGSRAATVAPPNTVQRLAESKRDLLARLLMAGGLVAAGER